MEAHALTVRLTHPVSNIIMKYAADVLSHRNSFFGDFIFLSIRRPLSAIFENNRTKCPKLVIIGPAWPSYSSLVQLGPDWPSMAQLGPTWPEINITLMK